ncbi:hypothetical protein AWM75_08090 [Aerococcus urinaehominis]|uniref:Uncharacterized protein n=1 Tax=Aerococcus urinaehominis TaxID=128944 RepID=A0A0X8FM99_9LACT|nr:ATP-binding cassette domain-containing protein [Aerococcus urinaehominis]AMB99931.1 hypothetical protein AWM75_08090 [Aerococcus urinaehominis]SDM42994.1 ABC transporter [Aerococcus urinaehominis]
MLLADEPTSALDPTSCQQVIELLKQLSNDMSQLIITHDLFFAQKIADRIIVLDKAMLSTADTDIFFNQQKNTIGQSMTNHASEFKATASVDVPETEIILKISELNKSYNNRKIIDNLSLNIHYGEVIGLIGESGCGKSTLVKCVMGLAHHVTGNIYFEGQNLNALSSGERRQYASSMQMIFQNARGVLNPKKRIIDIVCEGLNYQKKYRKSERNHYAKKYLKLVGLAQKHWLKKPPQLSTGQCQRVALARALAVEPKFLICDEATSALDLKEAVKLLNILKKLSEEEQLTVLLVSHDYYLLNNYCHRVVQLNEGTIKEVR